MSRTTRRRVIYHGRVQGVGFRATVCDLAADFPVTGYVRNLNDGTVELVADGSSVDLDAFLAAVSDRFSRHVTRADVQEVPAGEPFTGFTIRR